MSSIKTKQTNGKSVNILLYSGHVFVGIENYRLGLFFLFWPKIKRKTDKKSQSQNQNTFKPITFIIIQ